MAYWSQNCSFETVSCKNNSKNKNRNVRNVSKEAKAVTIPYKQLLPNSIATLLVAHYQCEPGSKILTQMLRAIATDIACNAITANTTFTSTSTTSTTSTSTSASGVNLTRCHKHGGTVNELLKYVTTTGDMELWAHFMPKHSAIV